MSNSGVPANPSALSGFFGFVLWAGIAILALFTVVEVVYGIFAVVGAIAPDAVHGIIPFK
jgi:hypothetical protein